MGLGASRAVRGYMAKYERRFLLLGLDGAGKTTLVHRLTAPASPCPTPTPTKSAAVEDVRFEGLKLSLWDVGGGDALRPYWIHHFAGTQGVVFVVDATDRLRIELAASELASVAEDEQLMGVPIALFVNKRDAPGALSKEEVVEGMKVEAVLSGPGVGERAWRVFEGSAEKGTGEVEEVIRFLVQASVPL